MSGTVGKNISVESATAWVRGSLAQGTELARLVSRRLSGLTQAVLLAPSSKVQESEPTLGQNSRFILMSEADAVAKVLLARLGGTSVLTLVVEDDVGRRGDRHVGRAAYIDDPVRYWQQRQAAYIGDRVLYWEQLDASGEHAVRLLRQAAYPLNAYLIKGSPADYGLASDKELSDRDLAYLAKSTRGVIVSVWDNEAFVAILAPEFRL